MIRRAGLGAGAVLACVLLGCSSSPSLVATRAVALDRCEEQRGASFAAREGIGETWRIELSARDIDRVERVSASGNVEVIVAPNGLSAAAVDVVVLGRALGDGAITVHGVDDDDKPITAVIPIGVGPQNAMFDKANECVPKVDDAGIKTDGASDAAPSPRDAGGD